jgi:hypothetical protein
MADRIGTLEETIARLLIDGGDTEGEGRINEDVPEAAEPSEPQLTDDMIREAQILSDRVSTILRKEQHNA